jgi:K+-sensing histidine kinase KdpD
MVGVALVTFLYKLAVTDINSTTVSLSFLLVVLAASSAYGLGPGILASIAGMFCFNFFFLPPFGTLTIHSWLTELGGAVRIPGDCRYGQ